MKSEDVFLKRYRRTICAALALLILAAGCAGAAAQPGTVSPGEAALLADPAELAGNSTLELIAAAYSPRNFAEGEVAQEDLDRILQSGAQAPSAKNLQPWHFTVIRNRETVAALSSQSQPGNVLIVLSGADNNVWTTPTDCGLAAGNMVLAAQSLGLGARILAEPINGVDKIRDKLGIPGDYIAHFAILVGPVESGPDATTSASPRKSLAELVNYVE